MQKPLLQQCGSIKPLEESPLWSLRPLEAEVEACFMMDKMLYENNTELFENGNRSLANRS